MRVRFHQSLGELKEKILIMAGMAEQSIERAVEAFRTRDLALCELVEQTEVAIDRYEREIDQRALDLLAMQQPMAIDLRFILAVIKINADVERVGDAAVNIVERVREMHGFSEVDLPVDIPHMAELAIGMMRRALQAFIEGDAEGARKVLALDDAVDKLNDSAYFALLNVMRQQPHYTAQALNALVIVRSLERVADHATNIAEDVIFWIRGADVRHYVPSPLSSSMDGFATEAEDGPITS